jgi:hypothetical protein
MPVDGPPAGPPKSLRARIGSMGNLVKAVIAFLALLPSVAVITDMIDIPPSLGQLVKIVTVPVSVVAIIGLFAQRRTIRRWSGRKAAIVFGCCALFGSAAAVSYYFFAEAHVFEYQGARMVSPIGPSAEIRNIIEPWDDRYDQALDNSPYKDRLQDLLKEESALAVIVMILLMAACQLLLVTAMVGSAWKLVVDDEDDREPGPTSS